MNLPSLKIRLLFIQAIMIILALGVTGWGIVHLFERQVERRIDAELSTYLNQLAAGITFSDAGAPVVASSLADPRFEKIYSGLYWQILNETNQISARSRSLWDVALTLPTDNPTVGKIDVHTIKGPKKSTVLIHERRLIYKSPLGEQTVRLVVALDMVDFNIMSSKFTVEIVISLLVLAIFLLLAGWFQIAFGLKPLAQIQKSIATIRAGTATRINAGLPKEVSPLVNEVNELLAAQEKTILKARHRSNDLAHGFKTPLTALKTDIQRLRAKGEGEIADDIELMFQALRRQIERELTTSRTREIKTIDETEIMSLLNGICTTLRRTPHGETKKINVECPQKISVQADIDDLAEILGNLLENAVKHAAKKITARVSIIEDTVLFDIEDDGKGISEKLRD
ncbi:MAG: HAMP domain-containing sensor histidine kinase, partial [Sneathiella sp.]